MPYIKEKYRNPIDDALKSIYELLKIYELGPSDLAYLFSKICNTYFDKSPNYSSVNNLLGVLEGTKLEFYRKKVAPYENKKEKENGKI